MAYTVDSLRTIMLFTDHIQQGHLNICDVHHIRVRLTSWDIGPSDECRYSQSTLPKRRFLTPNIKYFNYQLISVECWQLKDGKRIACRIHKL